MARERELNETIDRLTSGERRLATVPITQEQPSEEGKGGATEPRSMSWFQGRYPVVYHLPFLVALKDEKLRRRKIEDEINS